MKLDDLTKLGAAAGFLTQLKQAKSSQELILQPHSTRGAIPWQLYLDKDEAAAVLNLLIRRAEDALIAGGIEDVVPAEESPLADLEARLDPPNNPSQKEVDNKNAPA